MKMLNSLLFLIYMVTLAGCNFKSDHPQADLLKDESSTSMNDQSILSFTKNLKKNMAGFTKANSLVYMLGDNSLYVERYVNTAGDKIYNEHLINGNNSTVLNQYYFKKDSLIMVETFSKQIIENGEAFKDTRVYLRNNTVFKKETRTASSSGAIKSLPYLAAQTLDPHAEEGSYFEKIGVLNDAVEQHNKFEMVFDNITTYPDSRLLMLKSKVQNSYTSSVLIQDKNNFIDSLLNYSSTFKNEKLNFKWKIVDNEAVYVPDSVSTTSASGLNK